jgi:hypothetical protein
MPTPGDCSVTSVNLCEYQEGYTISASCPSSAKYQPPLPINVTVDGQHYPGTLSASDIVSYPVLIYLSKY